MIKNKIIAIDFDGTCVTHEYPKVGEDVGAQPVLKELVANGNRLILWTMRSGEALQNAIDWFKANDIPLFGANENPEQDSWTKSPKAYAHLYIDDAALGIPLRDHFPLGDHFPFGGRPYVDWAAVRELLLAIGK